MEQVPWPGTLKWMASDSIIYISFMEKKVEQGAVCHCMFIQTTILHISGLQILISKT